MPIDSEKITDHRLISKFEEVFKCRYNTAGNDKLFGSKIPDGWFEYDNNLFIIENKKLTKKQDKAYDQVVKYYNIAKETEEFKKYKECYLIIGYGTEFFKYEIYSTIDDNIELIDKTLEDFKNPLIDNIYDPNNTHVFNDYLFKYKIDMSSNEIFFVIAVLLCRKINPDLASRFNEKTNKFVIAEYLTNFIKEYYKDILFSASFDFMKYNLDNIHLYELIKMLNFDIRYYTNDILNQFYSEFVAYVEEPEVGIVLTPHDIVELMVRELDIKKGESIADFCTGTGSFLIEASKYTDKLIGCEDKEDLYTIAKSNFILHDLNTDKLYYNNCFNQKFEMYDHIILNPPFSLNCGDNEEIKDIYGWRDFKEERKFIIYQLQHLKNGGTGCFIIPRKNFNNSQSYSFKFKKTLLKYCDILKIYNCNNKVFKPIASTECIICVFRKSKTKNFKTEIIDYSNDGHIIKNNKRIKKTEPTIKSYKNILDYKDDWNYQNIRNNNIILPNVKFIFYTLFKNEHSIRFNKYMIEKDYSKLSKECEYFKDKVDSLENIKFKEWVEIKISDYFDFVDVENTFEIKKSCDGIYPLISSTSKNNGIAKFIDSYSIDIPECITVARNGTAGSCFYQSGKFAITGDVVILKLKEGKTLDLKLFSVLVTYFLTKKYDWSNKLSTKKLNKEIIYYPITPITEITD